MPSQRETLLLIDNRWVKGSGVPIPVSNPATGEVVGSVHHALEPELAAAVEAAQRGFEVWSRTTAIERSGLLRAASDLLRSRADAISEILTVEEGKPLAQARGEIMASADVFDWSAEEARRIYSRVIPSRSPDVTQTAYRRPIGPVAAFTPWNFPVSQAAQKLGAALAAGCSVVLKAPEETPASPAALIQVLVDCGLPAGVVNLVFGTPSVISEYLIPHPQIRKVSFTGSTAVGKHLAMLAGLHMKPATMELGGHAPVIIFDDADVEAAIATMASYKHSNAGQVCVSPTRFLVQDRLSEKFTEGYVDKVASIVLGDGLDPATEMGPLANKRRLESMERLVGDAVAKGAGLATGGRRKGNEGYFFEPTVLTNVDPSASIMNEEPFGPVSIINRFSSAEEAFAEANRLRYGLAAYVYTRSPTIAREVTDTVHSGMLGINSVDIARPEMPFGGIGDSGFGREGGAEATESYLETRLQTLRL